MAGLQTGDLDFDIVQVGTNGRFDCVARSLDKPRNGNDFPLITVAAGLPPVIPPLKSQVEEFLTDLESLPIHDFTHSQRLISREPQLDRLFHTELSPLQTTIQAERDATSGELLQFTEELIPDSSETSRNSLSLRRAPDINGSTRGNNDVRGSNINLPFWPGGLDDDLKFDDLITSTQGQVADQTTPLNFDDESLYLATPPGFDAGMDFSSKRQASAKTGDDESKNDDALGVVVVKGETGSAGDSATVHPAGGAALSVISLADIMAGGDDLDLGDSDQDEEEEANKPGGKAKKDQDEGRQIDTSGGEGLEELVTVQPESQSEAVSLPKASPPKEQWSVRRDTTCPVKDFYKRIPDMAYQWPFELDIFQKQAILCLENHENVFVAAHTSAGKTVVAEYAIALSLKHMTRTVYTSPIKALSNQKFRDFKMTFNDVGLITGDVQLNQTAACLIMTTEILRSMLYNGSEVIRDLEWVIFDEVHYINDSERGVVWEEVLIMLPQHVSVILLSATVPNAMEFADWVGRTKRKKMYVVSTPKRPVPLEHFLYTGNSIKTCNELFLLLDAKGSFLTSGYNKALEAKKERASKSSQSFGAKGPRGGNPIQDKNIWLSVIEMLKKKDKLPAVAFTFSKKKIEEITHSLQSVDLTSATEKSEIHVFFHRCISRLKGADRKLPQVLQLEDLLKRGLGIHHSGVLPILKEVVEMLFQRGLVKILYATETFAMGVNMPARTVLFDNTRKHDGLNFRNLLPGEYIQMAGRAGRRGLDTTGTVILLCKGDVPEMSELHKMMLGKPTSLESQFRLTYTMILNLMRVEQLRVQDMMKRSFSEFHHQKETSVHRESLEELKKKIAGIKNIECYLCSLDLEKYYAECKEYHRLSKYLQSVILSHPIAVKSLSPGRVVMVKMATGQPVLAVILQSMGSHSGERKFMALLLSEKESYGARVTEEKAAAQSEGIEPVMPFSLFLPEGANWHKLVELTGDKIARITNKTIKVDADGIIRDCRWREAPRSRNDPPQRCVTMATQELVRLSEANPSGLQGLHPVNDLKLRDIELVEQCRTLQFIEEGFSGFNCTRCSDFREHFAEHDSNMQIRDEFKRLQFLLSDDSLALLPEYTQRVEVLKRLNYIDSSGTVQLKGRVACEISNHELMVTELVFENVFTDMHPTDIAAVLSCFVFEMKKCSEPTLTDTLEKGRERVLEKAEMIGRLQREVGMLMPVEDFKEQFHFGLMEVVFEWARGMAFSEIIALTDVHEGIIVRSIQRLHETLSDVRNAARLIGDRTLAQKMEDAMGMIKRDIVFAASLYTQ